MTSAKASKLDIEKFRKVAALMQAGATDGERAAARTRASAMAANAGLTLEQAMSKLDAATQPLPRGFFEEFEDFMEEKEPGYRAQRAKEKAEREDRYATRRAEILQEFGTEEAFFRPTPLEVLLLSAGKPFVTKWASYINPSGVKIRYSKEFAGISGQFFRLAEVQPEAIKAAKDAIPFPQSIRAAFEELKVWDKLNRDRAHFFDHHEYYFDLEIELRIEMLREVMRDQPVGSWDDLEARFHYKTYSWEQQRIDHQDFDDPEWARLFEDIRILRGQADSAVQSGQRTSAQKRAAVLSILDKHPEMTDRAIAKLAGVSPQTVNNWRKKKPAAPDVCR